MTYKTIRNSKGEWCRTEFYSQGLDDSVEIYTSLVPELFVDITIERLEQLGIDTSDLEIVEVKLEEI